MSDYLYTVKETRTIKGSNNRIVEKTEIIHSKRVPRQYSPPDPEPSREESREENREENREESTSRVATEVIPAEPTPATSIFNFFFRWGK